MRYLIFSFTLVIFSFFLSCNKPSGDSQEVNNVQTLEEKKTEMLPVPAIKDPEPEQRKPTPLVEVVPQELGFGFKMNLPEGYDIKGAQDGKTKILYAQDGGFQLKVEETSTSLEDMKSYWKNSPEGYTFKKWILEGQNGLIVELEKDGKLEYHVDYLYLGNTPYRISTPVNQTFSQWQATQMFHACRMIEVLNRKS